MSKLVLVRDHPRDIAHRYAIMSLDGEVVARMKFKDRIELDIEPGRHTLQGKNELGKANVIDFEAKKGETVTIHLGGVPIGCFSWFAGVFPPTPNIVMQIDKPWDKVEGSGWK